MMLFQVPHYLRVQLFIAACLNLCELINGYGVGWAAPVLVKINDPTQSPLTYALTEAEKSWIVSLIFFGCIGTFPAGYLANIIGRKKSIIIAGIIHVIGYTMLSIANSLVILYIGRFLVGIGVVSLMALGTIYIGEISSPNIRGVILTSTGVSHALGSLLVYCVGPFVTYATVGYVAIGLNVVFIIVSCFLPESPMFHVLKDDESSARSVLEYIGRGAEVNKELKNMMERVREQRNNKHMWKEMFKSKCNRRSLLITVTLTGFQQGSGIIAVIMYANTIFRYTGSSIQPDIATIIVGATFVVGAFVAPMFIDKYGRRILLMISTAGLFVTMAGLGVYFYLKEYKPLFVENLGWLPLMFLVLAQFSYSFGLSIIPNTLSGELFTAKVRGLGPPLSISTGMMSGFLSTTAFGYIVHALGIHFTFWLYAICNALALLFVVFFVPETMGKSLMEIQEMLD